MEEITRAEGTEAVNQEHKVHSEIYKSELSLNSFRSSNAKGKNYRKISSVSVIRQKKKKVTKDLLCGKR